MEYHPNISKVGQINDDSFIICAFHLRSVKVKQASGEILRVCWTEHQGAI